MPGLVEVESVDLLKKIQVVGVLGTQNIFILARGYSISQTNSFLFKDFFTKIELRFYQDQQKNNFKFHA